MTRKQSMGARSVRGSDAARRLAALILEALTGLRTTQSASDAMGVALPRYYVLEARALQAFVTALEPRPRGRQPSVQGELERLRAEQQRLSRELGRYQSLYRVGQRALGVTESKVVQKPGKRRRAPRKKPRAMSVARVLQQPASEVDHDDGSAEQGSGSRGWSGCGNGREGPVAGDPGDDHR